MWQRLIRLVAYNRRAPRQFLETVETMDGFFWCGRCKHVVEPNAQQLASFDDAPGQCAATMRLKCPGCHRYEVRWKTVTRERPKASWGMRKQEPVSEERGKELFSDIKRLLGMN